MHTRCVHGCVAVPVVGVELHAHHGQGWHARAKWTGELKPHSSMWSMCAMFACVDLCVECQCTVGWGSPVVHASPRRGDREQAARVAKYKCAGGVSQRI